MENVPVAGPVKIRRYGEGPYVVVLWNPVIVTCGGPTSKRWATELACGMNQVFHKICEKHDVETIADCLQLKLF